MIDNPAYDGGMGAAIAQSSADRAKHVADAALELAKDNTDRLDLIERALHTLGHSIDPPPVPLESAIADLPEGSVVASSEMVFIAVTKPSLSIYRWRVSNGVKAMANDDTVAATYGATILRIGKG